MQLVSILRTLFAPGPKAKAPPSREIAAALDQTRADRDAAAAEADRLRGTRLAALVDEKSAASHSAELAAARQRVEDSDLLVEALLGHLAEAEAAERKAERERRYDEAKARRDAMARKFGPSYRDHISGIVALLRETTEVDLLIEQVNDDLPEGCAPLSSVERFRDRPGLPRRILRTDRMDLWVSPGGDQPIPDELQKRVERERGDRGDGQTSGVIRHVNKAIGHHSTSHYVLKRFERVTYLESTAGETGRRLREMALPGLLVGEPDVYRPQPGGMDTRDVFPALERAAAQPIEPPEQDLREKRVEFRLIRDELPVEGEAAAADTLQLVLPETQF